MEALLEVGCSKCDYSLTFSMMSNRYSFNLIFIFENLKYRTVLSHVSRVLGLRLTSYFYPKTDEPRSEHGPVHCRGTRPIIVSPQLRRLLRKFYLSRFKTPL